MKSLYSRNNSFNHPIFHSKFLELLSRNNKTKKKITMESLSFRHILSTSKISNTNSYANTNTNTNTNSLIKQNKPKKKNSKTKININSKHKYSMSNDIFNFNDYNKRIYNLDAIHTIYTSKANSKNKINYNSIIKNTNTNTNVNTTKKRSKSKNNNCIKKEKSKNKSKNKKIKSKKNNSKIFINLENDLSLKKENQRLKLQLLELQSEYEKLKNENDVLLSQNKNKNNTYLSKQREKTEISNEKKTKKINKLNCNNLNLEINNIDNNYPCDYFSVINTKTNNSPIHDIIPSNKRVYNINNMQDIDVYSNKISRDNINYDNNGSVNYFTIGNNDKINNNVSYNSKILNTSKNKILISMYNLKNIKTKLNKSNTRLITPGNTSYTSSTLLNTEKFVQNLKKNKLKEKLRPQQLIYVPNNKKSGGSNFIKDNLNDKINSIIFNKGKKNLFDLHKKNNSARNNNQNKNKLIIKENIKNINIKQIDSNKATKRHANSNSKDKNFQNLQDKMSNLYERAKKLLLNYDHFIENNIHFEK